MLDEIISAIAGNAIARLVSKLLPARRAREFADVPFEMLKRRNKTLYFWMLAVAVFGFFLPYLAIAVGHAGGPWVVGAIFGLPFSAMLIFIMMIWSLRGGRRAHEFLFYFEIKQRTNIYVFYFLGAPLSVIGVVSMVFMLR
jgi:hypothetical protein